MTRQHLTLVGSDDHAQAQAVTRDQTEALLKEFIAQSDVAESTKVRYRASVGEFATWLAHPRTPRSGGPCSVVDASRSDVARFMAYLLSGDRYAVADHHRKVALPSASTRKSTLACLHSFYKYLLTVDVVKHDPTTGVDRPKVKTKPGFRLSAEELRKLLDAPGAPRCKIQVYLIDDDLSADAVGALAEAYEAATGERITSEFHEA